MPLPLTLQKCLSGAVCASQAYWRPFSTFTHETIAPARTALEMAFTHAEPRLKPLGDPFQASSAETSVHKRSHSYSGYIPYYPQPSTTILTIRYVADAVFRLKPTHTAGANGRVRSRRECTFTSVLGNVTSILFWGNAA